MPIRIGINGLGPMERPGTRAGRGSRALIAAGACNPESGVIIVCSMR